MHVIIIDIVVMHARMATLAAATYPPRIPAARSDIAYVSRTPLVDFMNSEQQETEEHAQAAAAVDTAQKKKVQEDAELQQIKVLAIELFA